MFSMPSIFGVILIIAIKFAGYRYAGILLNKHYGGVSANPNIFGIVRVVLGLAAGSLFAFILAKWDVNNGMVVWYVWLFPLRFFEWLLVIGVFHERKAAERKPLRLCRLSILGTIWSFILDVTAAIVVMVTPGAFMIIC